MELNNKEDALNNVPLKHYVKLCELLTEKNKEIERLKAVLEDIANPMRKLQEDAEKEGAQLNGVMAIQLCKDGNWLREKAKAALQ